MKNQTTMIIAILSITTDNKKESDQEVQKINIQTKIKSTIHKTYRKDKVLMNIELKKKTSNLSFIELTHSNQLINNKNSSMKKRLKIKLKT